MPDSNTLPKPSRRQFLAGASVVGAGAVVAGTTNVAVAASGDPLITEVQDWAIGHGDGVDNWPALSGGQGTLDQDDPVKTVGSYWPLPVHSLGLHQPVQALRQCPESGSGREICAVAPQFPGADDAQRGRVHHRRPGGAEYPIFSREPCMNDCKEPGESASRAGALGVTPQTEAAPDWTAAGAGPDQRITRRFFGKPGN